MAKAANAVPLRGRKLTVSFGLVNVPVRYKPLTETERPVPGKLMCPEHGPTINSKLVCSVGTDEEHMLERDEAKRGFPHPEKGGYVVVEKEKLKELEEARDGIGLISKIVPLDEIDPAYFEKAYLLWPEPGGEQGFDLLSAYLAGEGKVAQVETVMGKQTKTVLLRWSTEFQALLGHVVHFTEQLRHADADLVFTAASKRAEPAPAMLEAAGALFATLEGEFDATEAVDQYTPLLQNAIRAADKGEEYKPPVVEEAAPVEDIMAALEASVEMQKTAKKPAKKKKKAA